MSSVTMLCYNVNTDTHDFNSVIQNFSNLGYHIACEHESNACTIMSSNRCLIMITGDTKKPTGLTGIMLDKDHEELISKVCEVSNFNFMSDPNGFTVYVNTPIHVSTVINQFYTRNERKKSNVDLQFHVGIVFDHCDPSVVDFYEQLDFRSVIDDHHFLVLVCSKNRFHLIFNKQGEQASEVTDIVTSVNSIRSVCAYYASKQIPAAKFDLDKRTQEIYSIIETAPPKHTVKSWDLALCGKGNRWTLDNYYKNPIPNTSLVISYRNNYNSICLENLSYFHTLGND